MQKKILKISEPNQPNLDFYAVCSIQKNKNGKTTRRRLMTFIKACDRGEVFVGMLKGGLCNLYAVVLKHKA